MRHRRQGLQVSTFPFLAVLLCTMGSLILLMLVIDRRAKVVARAKALHLQTKVLDDQIKAAKARKAEWERRRQILHEQLVQEDQALRDQTKAAEDQARDTGIKLQDMKARLDDLRARVRSEKDRVGKWEEELNSHKRELAQQTGNSLASTREMERLTADLVRLERTLEELKTARKRQQQVYSLVPYRGKRGDNRKPIYLECTANAVIFHPDRLALGIGPGPAGSTIRAEIERRLARERDNLVQASNQAEDNAYLLMLVRPAGVTTYYRAVAALHGLKIDFGYEFIDADWALDFPTADGVEGRPLWPLASLPASTAQKSATRKVGALNPEAAYRPQTQARGIDFGGGTAIDAPGAVPLGSGRYGPNLDTRTGNIGSGAVPSGGRHFGALGPGPLRGSGVPGMPSTGSFVTGDKNGSQGAGGTGVTAAGGPASGSGIAGESASVTMLRPSPSPNRGSGLGNENLPSGGPVSPSVSEGRPEPGRGVPANPVVSRSSGVAGGRSGGDQEPVLGSSQQNGGFGTQTGTGPASNVGTGSGDGPASGPSSSSTGPNQRDSGADPGIQAPPIPVPSFGAKQGGTSAARPENATEPGTASGTSSGGTDAGGGQPAEAGEPGPRRSADPVATLAARAGVKQPSRAQPFRPGLMNSNRDWLIPIECTAESLILLPSGQRFALGTLPRGAQNNPLVETLQQMIAHRQATVREGDPPYRPMIRFRVRPDGLRAYYLAYPAVETLRLPMSRESIDPAP